MKRSLSELIFADCLFILFLSVSGAIGGALGTVFYAAAFVLPVMLLLFLWKRGDRENYKISVFSSRFSLKLTTAFTFPIIFSVLLMSFLTSALMGAIGVSADTADFEGNLIYIITVRALAPAIFEEMLFRYLPIMALGSHSPRLAVIYSAVLFALSHCNLFQIPYALIAGVAFAALDVAAGSVLPSMIIHFFNNILSIGWQRNYENTVFSVIFLSAILLLTVLSVIWIYLRRKKIKTAFSPISEDKSKLIFTYPFGMYIAMTLVIAASAFVI